MAVKNGREIAKEAPNAPQAPDAVAPSQSQQVNEQAPTQPAGAQVSEGTTPSAPPPPLGLQKKRSIIDKLAGKIKEFLPGIRQAIKDSPASLKGTGKAHHTNRHIRKQIVKSKKIRKLKKKLSKENFTARGLIRAIKLQETLEKAGMESKDPKLLAKRLLDINLVVFGVATIYLLVNGFINGINTLTVLTFALGIWIGVFPLAIALSWASYLFYLDMKIYQRTREVEKVFPDFLQLASSNISAGMPIDQAMWYAVRPNFGVLVKEIEIVAKNTIAGKDLSESLIQFADKYDSKVIRRSINLLLVGLQAGGELAELLNKVALNIEESRIIKKDMAANVTTYVIFITFASIVAAPALLGLSTQLLEVITRITASVGAEVPQSSTGFITFSFSSEGMSVKNFKIFSYVMLIISSIFAAGIVNVIQKGSARDGIAKYPTFIMISVVIYTSANIIMSNLFSTLI
jgi:Flp pilus assembly protein TadB